METSYDEALAWVRQALENGNCGKAIDELDMYLSVWPEAQTQDRLRQLKADYELMEEYWRQGADDPERERLFHRLLRGVYVLYANLRHHYRMKASPYQRSLYTRVRQAGRDWSLTAIRQEMESFVSGVALLELEPEHTREAKSERLYRDHQRQMNQLFEYVLTSRQWTDTVGSRFTEMMLSPTIDSIDQQLLIAAVSIALMNQFDMAKFRMLTEVYSSSQDEEVRQRALVGWVLSLGQVMSGVFPEVREVIGGLLRSETVCQELTELQIQLIYCLNEERDTTTIRQEIMPDLIKNNHFKITSKGLEEAEDDPLEDVLHPDAAEQRMEKLESAFQRMMDMQKQGSDIYFGGFSQMKRFPFFYDISNWLVPFYRQHPDITQQVRRMRDYQIIFKVMRMIPFCNSDKYSFVLAFDDVVKRLPEDITRMLHRGEAAMDEELAAGGELGTAAFKRRAYLMDLYRFFRLFPHRAELYNPFSPDAAQTGEAVFFCNSLFGGTPLEGYKSQIVRLLKRQKMETAASRLLDTFREPYLDEQYYLWRHDFARVLQLNPHHEAALRGQARGLFEDGRYQEARELYERLLTLRPDKLSYQLNKIVCMVQDEDYEEALGLLFRLNYEQPRNDSVNRALAWTLTCTGRSEQAMKYYRELTSAEHPMAEDWLNQGYCLWQQGKIDEAAGSFKKYVRLCEESSVAEFVFTLDDNWLAKRGVTGIELKMMLSLVSA